MTAVWTIARALAFGHGATFLWRRVAVGVSTTVAVIALTFGFAVINSIERSEERSQSRAIAILIEDHSRVPEGVDGVWFLSGLDRYADTQFLVNWVEPAGTTTTVLPPGMDSMPDPGVAVVSPALATLIEQDTSLSDRYPSYHTLDWNGVANADELIAWVRPADRDLFLSNQNVVFVEAFNADINEPVPWGSTLDTPVPRSQVMMFMVLVIVVPITVLLFAGISAHDGQRERRLSLLRQIGVGDRWLFQLSILETLMVLIPIALVVTPLTSLYLGTLDRTPFIGRQVVQGDLSLSVVQCLAVVGSAVGMVILVSFIRVFVVSRIRRIGHILPKLHKLFVVAALLVAAYVSIILAPQNMRNGRAIALFMANLMIVLAVVPLLLRPLLAAIGDSLARSGRTMVQLGGARLGYLSRFGVGPTVGISLAIVVLLQLLGLVTMFKGYAVFVDNSISPSSAEVRAAIPLDTLETEIKSSFPEALVFPVYYGGAGSGEVTDAVFGIACSDVAGFLDSDQSLCESDVEGRSDSLWPTFYMQSAYFDPSYPDDGVPPDSLMVVSNESMHMVDRNVRAALPPAEFPGISISTPESYRISEPEHTPWIEQGAIAAVAILGLAVLLTAIDQSMNGQQYAKRLIAIGASLSTVRLTHLVLFIVPGVVAIALGLFLGLVELLIFRRLVTFSLAAVPIVPVIVVSLVSVVLAGLLVAALNTRVALADWRSE